MKIVNSILLTGMAVAAVSLATGPAVIAQETVSTPSGDQCISEAREQIDAFIAGLDTTAIEVLHQGQPIYRYGDVARTEGLYIASVRKSVLALLYGPWVESGTIDLDATLAELGIDDIEGLTDDEKQATIRHLITSRSGIYHPASNGGDAPNKPARGTYAPGEYFIYNNWDFNAAGAVFEQLTGMSVYDAFDAQIAQPIGLSDYDAAYHNENRPQTGPDSASQYPAYHFSLSARDLARVGQLVAQRGAWDGEQVVSEAWIDEMLEVHTTLEEVRAHRRVPFAYGYMWWLVKADIPFSAVQSSVWGQGAWGQYVMANSELGLAAGHVTEPRMIGEGEEQRRAGTATSAVARSIQRAWDGYQRCNAPLI